jgi:hypothetical protein
MRLGEVTLEEAAKEAAGNWRKFDSFCWHRARDLDDADQWCIVYTNNRDSGLLDLSNAAVIGKTLQRFVHAVDSDVVPESHYHWACGWIAGYSIRVFKRGRITRAFRKYQELSDRLAVYPILDEADYSDREYKATLANIPDAAWKLKYEYDLPQHWESDVYHWLSDNDPGAIESRDDQGGYPNEDQLRAAFDALGYEQAAIA